MGCDVIDSKRTNGLFERWQESAIHYLVPETGEVFEIACAESNL